MCGIVGIYAKDSVGLENHVHLKKAVESLYFRGPDANGTFFHQQIGLGHSRLSIIDTTTGANQPFISADGRYVLTFNGEIYNYKALRQKLEQKGVQFTTSSDTEVLLYHLIENEPEAALNALNGFFAFAFYDKQTNETIIARDRIGIKPLHIYEDDHHIIWGSEMKALLAFKVQKEIDPSALQLYFKFNYIPQPYSIYKHFKKLQPGEYLIIKDGKSSTKLYYTIPFEENSYQITDYAEAQNQLRNLMEESVAKRMVADVPIGAFLSGGIDSSVIVALASKQTQHLNTFSIGYKDEPLFDETKYAELVAKKYKTNHTVFSLTNDDLFNQLDKVLDYTDEPFADSSGLAVNILSMQTATKAKVALSGDGADEIFSGYNKHKAEYIARSKSIKNKLIAAGLPLWEQLPKSRNSKIGNINRQLLRFSEGVNKTKTDRYWDWAGILKDEVAGNMLIKTDAHFEAYKNTILSSKLESNDYNGVLYQDVKQVLVSDMLTKVDMNSMSNSLEVRVPFLDHNVVEFAFQIPSEFKINSQVKKKILQETFRSDLPNELFNRPKHGFEVPLIKWFRGPLWERITKVYCAEDFIVSQGIFEVQVIRDLLKKLQSNNPEDSAATIWAIIVFQHWWKKWHCAATDKAEL